MPKSARLHYYQISRFDNLASIELASMEEFVQLLDSFSAKHLFREKKEGEGAVYSFFCEHDKLMYILRDQEFHFIEDHEESKAHLFPSAKDYYEAKGLGFTHFKEFDECRKAGLTDRAMFTNAQKGGYIDGYSKLNERMSENKANIQFEVAAEVSNINNAIELYQYAEKRGFANYKEFEKAILRGFRTMAEHSEATKLGFENGSGYRRAISLGFDNAGEYNDALLNQVNNKKEYIIYKSFKSRARFGTMDEIVLMDLINNLPNGKKISLFKLEEEVEAEVKRYYFDRDKDDEKILCRWFSRKLVTRNAIKECLKTHEKIRTMGVYDPEGEYFEIFKIRSSKVFVDGSNVAHNSNDKNKERPQLQRIFAVIKALNTQRFNNVVVIADASLKHRVSDANNLKNIESICTYLEAPAGTTADEFLISNARKENGFIVTNDMFRDWKLKDKWVAEHIDNLRIPFLIQNGLVSFSLPEKVGDVG